MARLKSWHYLRDLDKITYNKADKEIVTFIFKSCDGAKPRGYVYVLAEEQVQLFIRT